MAKFKLFWENSPDTPLSSERLSSFLNYYSDQPILYFDSENEINNEKKYLKIRDSFKANIEIPKTSLGLDFNYSLISYNSKFKPLEEKNIVFRDDYKNSPGSIALDESIENILTNPGFEDGLDGWIVENSGDSSIESYDRDYYPRNLSEPLSVQISVDEYGNIPRLKRVVTTDYTGNLSLSFYYKTSSKIYVQIVTRKNNVNTYWNGNNWVLSNTYFTMFDTENEWSRFELERIDVNLTDFIEIYVYSDEPNSYHYLDSFLLERKDFCSSYLPTTLGSSFLAYDKDVFNMDEGLIEFVFYAKHEEDITFFVMKATTSEDVLRFRYNTSYQRFEFIYYNKFIEEYENRFVSFSYGSLINKWNRIIISWSFKEGIINFDIDGYPRQVLIPENSVTIDPNFYERFYIGSHADGSEVAKGMFEFFKIDSRFETRDEIDDDILQPPRIKENDYKVFENGYKSLIVDSSLLDEGSSLEANKSYFLWICDNENSVDCEVLLSKNEKSPIGYSWLNSRMFGGFRTDNDSNIIENSIWDLSTYLTHDLHIDRLLIGGTRTLNIDDVTTESPTPVEIRTQPWGEGTDATFNLDSTFTRHVYGRNTQDGNFLDIDTESGQVFIDTIRFDGHSINGIDTNLELYTTGSNTVNIHSDEVDIKSEGTDIKLDDVRVVNDTIYIKDGNTLKINSNLDDADNDNNIEIISYDIDSNIKHDFNVTANNDTNLYANQMFYITSNQGDVEISASQRDVKITSEINTIISSTEGFIKLDDIKINGNKFYRDELNKKILFESTDNIELLSNSGNVKIEDYNFNNNKIFINDESDAFIQFVENEENEDINVKAGGTITIDSPIFHVKSPDIRFDTVATDFIRLDSIRISANQIYTGSGDTMQILSPENITIDSGSTLKLEGKVVDINSVDGIISLDNVSVNGNTIETLDNDSQDLTLKGNTVYIDGTSGRVDIVSDSLYVNSGDGIIYANATSATEFKDSVSLILKTDDTSKIDAFSSTKILKGTEGTITFNINHTHDGRYYTESEADSRFVNVDGDTLNGRLELSHTNGDQNVLRVFRKVDQAGSPAAILVATDADPGDDVAFEIRGNSDGSNVDTTENTQSSDDMKLQIWGDGNLNTKGEITADKVWNAVWMDLAECWDKDNSYRFSYNIAVVQTKNGIKPSEKRAEKGSVGVISDTYGYVLNSGNFDPKNFEGSKSLPIAIAGRVKVVYKGKIEIGEEVVSYKDGMVVRANIFEKIFKRERILGRVDSFDDDICTIKVY